MLVLANQVLQPAAFGKGLAFPLQIDPVTQDFKRSSGEENVRQCLMCLISTPIGSRVMAEDVGIDLMGILFENVVGACDILPHRIREAIERYEPRVAKTVVTASPLPANGAKGVGARIEYVYRATGRRDNLVWPYYLENARASEVQR
jgi:phage baseplate assembly protein W